MSAEGTALVTHAKRGDYQFSYQASGIPQSFRFDQPIRNVRRILLEAYEIREVPVAAGVPLQSRYKLRINASNNLSMPVRLQPTADACANAFPLALTGEVTRWEYQIPKPVCDLTPGVLSDISFTLLNPDGTPALFDSCTLYLLFIYSEQESTLQDVLSARPEQADMFATSVSRGYFQ